MPTQYLVLLLQVCWVPALSEQMKREKHWLLSLGNDGKVLLWELCREGLGKHQGHLQLLTRMQLRANTIPRSLKVSKVNMDAEMGGEDSALAVNSML